MRNLKNVTTKRLLRMLKYKYDEIQKNVKYPEEKDKTIDGIIYTRYIYPLSRYELSCMDEMISILTELKTRKY